MDSIVKEAVRCYHCGDECREELIRFDGRVFCCDGCRLVYDILQENNLCSYYQYNASPGVSPKNKYFEERFAFLDDETVRRKLIRFTDEENTLITFHVPQMHCSSCIWLLENLNRINPGVTRSQVNFLRREVTIYYEEDKITLRRLVEMMATIGYEPLINLDDLDRKRTAKKDRTPVYKIGIAGFAFGNIMLFSFPEYFSLSDSTDPGFKGIFSYLNLALSLPVFFYCSSQFFISAWQSLKQKYFNIDVPIALGILVMFLRSSYEILSATGAGYFDTMAGLVFFMLVGRKFQDKTYETLSFERDYKSFFPIAVMCRRDGKETSVPVSSLVTGDRIFIRNEELIPADAVLLRGTASIDYSFVTGEAVPVSRRAGELIYAGGKQRGAMIELEIVKEVSQSYLTQLWNNEAYRMKEEDNRFQQLVNRISHSFTFVIIGLSLAGLAYWFWSGDFPRGWNAFTAVLIIACPCALAIASPFTLGNILRIFGRQKFYLKNYSVIEKLAQADTVVFDKTGTITQNNRAEIAFIGDPLSAQEMNRIRSLVRHSSHPLSRLVYECLPGSDPEPVSGFMEWPGKGISGTVSDTELLIGSADFTGAARGRETPEATNVFVVVGGVLRGYFSIRNSYREGLENVVQELQKKNYRLVVVSGDNESERDRIAEIFGSDTQVFFRQSPADKLRVVQALQKQGRRVLMIGDGLNDAGALKQSDAGISISDDVNNFSPACDAILDASNFSRLGKILATSKASRSIIYSSFVIALLYNIVGLSFALHGSLSPVVAAILMPVSSVTIIAFTTGTSNWMASR